MPQLRTTDEGTHVDLPLETLHTDSISLVKEDDGGGTGVLHGEPSSIIACQARTVSLGMHHESDDEKKISVHHHGGNEPSPSSVQVDQHSMQQKTVSEAKVHESVDVNSVEDEALLNGQPYEGLQQMDDTSAVATAQRYARLCGEESRFLDAITAQEVQPDHTPLLDDNDFFGMGSEVRRAVFETYGIRQLREWQINMLKSHTSEVSSKNALILAPTSSGKTLVAVILLLRCLIVQRRDAILALPFVAIVAEKVRELKLLATKLNIFTVAEYAGKKGRFPPPVSKNHLRTLYVASTEKANGIWKLLCKTEDRRLEIGTIVIDEIHMISQGKRGVVVEELVTQFLYWCDSASRLLAMSATVGNTLELRRFVGAGSCSGANIYQVSNRPTEVEEFLVVGGSAMKIVKDTESNRRALCFNEPAKLILLHNDILKNSDLDVFNEDDWRFIARLVFDALSRHEPVLVFCGTKVLCQQLCVMLTKVHNAVFREQNIASDDVKRQREYLIGHLQSESKGRVPPELLKGIRCGIGFHNASLHTTERKALEEAYTRGIINVLTCTTTLAMGINLPASRIIIVPFISKDVFISSTSYIQMVGRGGRGCAQNPSSRPDSYIFLPPSQVGRFEALLMQDVESVRSELLEESMYYNRCMVGHVTEATDKHNFNGVTRLLMSSLEIGSDDVLKLTDLISMYKLTLQYQIAKKKEGSGSMFVRSIKPLLLAVQSLVKRGFLTVLSNKEQDHNPKINMHVEEIFESDGEDFDAKLAHRHRPHSPENWMSSTTSEKEDLELELASAINKGSLQSPDYGLRLTAFAIATASGSLSLDDATKFVAEINEYQERLCMRDYLIFLYLSLTKDMCRPIVDPPTSTRAVYDATTLISEKIATPYTRHSAMQTFEMVGLPQNKVELWSKVSPRIRSDPAFNDKLTRMWSALFLNDLIQSPEAYEELCVSYGFDRGMVLELSTSLASRCMNLKSFCLALDEYWWYANLANIVAAKLQDSAIDEIRPLMELNHVTPASENINRARAKDMVKMGLKTIRDVALVDAPLVLSERVRNMPKWTAAEIVFDARLHMMQDAVELAAESEDCKEALRRKPVTTNLLS
ncbi:Helicase POLQ-like [Frankliniella fusca]|uniref:Helicase POLQ-like n=1 Tax=Frankliniella fusca TaxID=407009 RepID=A0AAE1L6R6_9NEOP|nr:Helicase POLQ-like [Frankliniella fusca]